MASAVATKETRIVRKMLMGLNARSSPQGLLRSSNGEVTRAMQLAHLADRVGAMPKFRSLSRHAGAVLLFQLNMLATDFAA